MEVETGPASPITRGWHTNHAPHSTGWAHRPSPYICRANGTPSSRRLGAARIVRALPAKMAFRVEFSC
ncbi:hypothetical protein DdX_03185 [Ditylenchus destructor]|uniref:Uncharacterized protein n=1 Tax=Ditylenchus destructor TaxID=166010 RepID=A0AAD4R9S6_9BILA|nr:hypothetical protein DdX_03185 [Ditylenchus destructor]